jgi:hypothetical protein
MKSIFKYDRYKMNLLVFGVVFSIVSVWTLLSFFYAWAKDEGTLGNNLFDNFMADSFNVWRFPFHNILFLIVDVIPFLGVLFFPLLILNILFYSIIIERSTTILFNRKNSFLSKDKLEKE